MINGIWLLFLGACGDDAATAPLPSRVQSIAQDPKQHENPEAFCDSWTESAASRRFPRPALAEGAWSNAPTWRWVNVWATWCGPCIAEMPTLVKWQEKLKEQGLPVDLVFLSVDKGQAEVDHFYARHPTLPPSKRIADVSALPGWLGELGLDAGTAIPIHLFVDREDRLRCVRTGSLGDHHQASVRGVLSR